MDIKQIQVLCNKIAKGSATIRGQVQVALIEASVVAFETERNVQPFDMIVEAVTQNRVIRKAGISEWVSKYSCAHIGKTCKLDRKALEGFKAKFETADEYRAFLTESPMWDETVPEENFDFDVAWRQVFIKAIKAAKNRMEKAKEAGGKPTQSDLGLLDKIEAEIAAYNLATTEV